MKNGKEKWKRKMSWKRIYIPDLRLEHNQLPCQAALTFKVSKERVAMNTLPPSLTFILNRLHQNTKQHFQQRIVTRTATTHLTTNFLTLALPTTTTSCCCCCSSSSSSSSKMKVVNGKAVFKWRVRSKFYMLLNENDTTSQITSLRDGLTTS